MPGIRARWLHTAARLTWGVWTTAITALLIIDFGPTREVGCPESSRGTICLLRIEHVLPTPVIFGIGLFGGWIVWRLSRPPKLETPSATSTARAIPLARVAVATLLIAATTVGASILAWGIGSDIALAAAVALVGLNLGIAAASRRPSNRT
jgi:hypothetical protein